MQRIALLASGGGSNAEQIIRYFKNHQAIKVTMILTNRADAGVLERAERLGVPSKVFSESDMQNGRLLSLLRLAADWVILAGFLRKIPPPILAFYPHQIINIHPALLPKYGGKGMYGMYVHQAVKDAVDTETGITIHLVDEVYDEGVILHQEKTAVAPTDAPADIAKKVQVLEHRFFPKIIEQTILKDA